MRTAIIGGEAYALGQFKLRELIAAAPYMDEAQEITQRALALARAAAQAAGAPLDPKAPLPLSAVDQYALMRATVGTILPGIQAATVSDNEPLSKSPITLDDLLAKAKLSEMAGLAALVPHLHEEAGIEKGEPQLGSAAASPGETPDPSLTNSETSSSSSSPADAKAEASPS